MKNVRCEICKNNYSLSSDFKDCSCQLPHYFINYGNCTLCNQKYPKCLECNDQ